MSTDEYVPNEQDLEVAWIESEASADDINVASAEFDRFLARVRRDAAREALHHVIDRIAPDARYELDDGIEFAIRAIEDCIANHYEETA